MNYEEALTLLEQEHLKFQADGYQHTVVHIKMFLLALKHMKFKEVWGQIPRILLAYVGSVSGRYPKGNVGSTRMGIFETSDRD